MKTLFTTFLLCLMLVFTMQAQTSTDKEYQAALTKMLKVSNCLEALQQTKPQIIAMMKQEVPEAPQAFWDDQEKTMASMYDEVIKAIVLVYQKYLTLQDLQKIITFYESPAGKKLMESEAPITTEITSVAQQIATQTMQKLMQKAQEKGYLKQQ